MNLERYIEQMMNNLTVGNFIEFIQVTSWLFDVEEHTIITKMQKELA